MAFTIGDALAAMGLPTSLDNIRRARECAAYANRRGKSLSSAINELSKMKRRSSFFDGIGDADIMVLRDALSDYWCKLRTRSDGVVMADAEFARTASHVRQANAMAAKEMLEEAKDRCRRT